MKVFLILHNVRSLHNVGSIFRTADGAGVKKIYLTGYTPGPYDFFGPPVGGLKKDFQKTALGAEKYIEWETTRDINKLIAKLKKENLFILSLENRVSGAIDINHFFRSAKKNLKRKSGIVLILGNEVRGIPKSVLQKSDAVAEIPMRGKKESLNVSIAAGIALFGLIK